METGSRPGRAHFEGRAVQHASPDGRWLAYVSNATGTYQVNVRALSGAGVHRQISTNGGSQPQWRNDDELIYMAPDRSLMSVATRTSAETFSFEPPQQLFRTRTRSFESQGTERAYAVASGGKRFLVANATEEAKSASILVDLNWRSAFAQVMAATAASARSPANGRSSRTRC